MKTIGWLKQKPRALRAVRIVAIAVVITALFAYLDLATHALDYFEQLMYGDRLEVAGLVHPEITNAAESRIAVVSVGDATYRWAANGKQAVRYIPRSTYAKLIDKLTGYGAKVIAFDILFDTPDAGDTQLAASIHRSQRVLLACGDAGDQNVEVTYPEPIFLDAGCRLGHSRVPLSVDRPAVDEIEPTVRAIGGVMPAMSVEAVRMYRGAADIPLNNSLQLSSDPGLPLRTDAPEMNGAFKIRYLYSPDGVFSPIPLEAIVSANQTSDAVYREVFRNKIVFIGDTTKIGHDRYLTPLETMPGVLIQANATATVLNGQYIRDAPNIVEIFLLTLLVGFTALASALWPLRRVAALIIMILPTAFLFNVWLFVQQDYYLHLVGPSCAIFLTAMTVLLERGLVEETEKARIRALLLRYVNPKIADHILKNPEVIGAGGKRQVGTILFSDLRDFTRLSNEMEPEELVARMNEYFQVITEIIFRRDGTVVSIVGDAMMAVFGIPLPATDHAEQAIAAAAEIHVAERQLREKWKTPIESSLSSGIGINTGEVIVGEVGGKHLRNFTVYGLQVNIASRVENLNAEMHTKTLITRSTYEVLEHPVNIGAARSVNVKGLTDAIDVFEIIELLNPEI
jgi:adenylate cyclase